MYKKHPTDITEASPKERCLYIKLYEEAIAEGYSVDDEIHLQAKKIYIELALEIPHEILRNMPADRRLTNE